MHTHRQGLSLEGSSFCLFPSHPGGRGLLRLELTLTLRARTFLLCPVGERAPPGGSSKSYDSVSLASALGEAVLCFVVLGCHGLASFLLGFDCLPFGVTAGHAPAPEPVAPTVLRVYLGDDAPD